VRLPSRPILSIATAAALAVGALSVIPSTAADAATSCAPNSSGTTPSLAVQNACGDHAMGSSELGASASPSATPAPTPSTAPAPSATPNASGGTAQAPNFSAQAAPASDVKGFDISYYQGSQTNWAGAVSAGYKFVFIKSTEGTDYVNSYFNTQWVNAGKYGLLRGTYHFARPALSSGAAQAQYFYANGASMSATTPGTLPPVVDLESTPDGECSGLSKAGMVSWLSSFMSTLKSLTGRTPIIYTNWNWWYDCTGNSTALASQYPLWMAYYTSASSPSIPSSWKSWAFWQWGGSPSFTGGGDADVFESSSLATLTSSYGTYPRTAGTDRYATSTSVAQQFLSAASTTTATPKPGQTVYIASGTNFPDALSGAPAAGLSKSPVVLVQSNWISGIVINQLNALKPKKIVILGGTSAIDAAVQKALAGYTASGSASAVTRIGGSDRYATSADVATANFSAGVKNAYVAVGTNWPDALSGGAAAAAPSSAGPILLVQSKQIPSSVAQALAKLRPQKITVFGGTTAVSSSVLSALKQYTASKSASSVTRLGGADRFATSALIGTGLFSSGVPVAYAASGQNFPDALAGAPLSSLSGGAPVLLTNQAAIPSVIGHALTTLKPKSVDVLGGANAISSSVQTALLKYVVN